jgi:hypothetical protein
MPAKRRLSKDTRFVVSDAARVRWQAVGGIDLDATGRCGVITDNQLAHMLGRLPLIAYPDMGEILNQIRRNPDETR